MKKSYFQYQYGRQADAENVEDSVGDGRVFEREPDGCIITVESALKRLAEQVQE